MAVKICVIGPSRSGKTLLSKCLASQILTSAEDGNETYEPTAGIRIQQYECPTTHRSRGAMQTVHLYDCSGDMQYQTMWKVMASDADGVIIVQDPQLSQDRDQKQQLDRMYNTFVEQSKLGPERCLVVAMDTSGRGRGAARLTSNTPKLQKLRTVSVSFDG